jgi:hypothetical protein
LNTCSSSYIIKLESDKNEKIFYTYKSGHNNSDLLDGSLELIKIHAASVLDIEIFELLVQEGDLVNILRVLLLNLFSKLLVKSTNDQID